jgi:hypothetical protein
MMRVTQLIGDRQAAKHDLRRCYTRDGYVSLISSRKGRIGRKSMKRELWARAEDHACFVEEVVPPDQARAVSVLLACGGEVR